MSVYIVRDMLLSTHTQVHAQMSKSLRIHGPRFMAQYGLDPPFLDSTIVRAHQHSASVKGGPNDGSPRPEPGWVLHQPERAAEDGGGPPAFVLQPGKRHKSQVFEQLMNHGVVKRQQRGRQRPQRLVADKGYSSCRIRH